MAIQIIFCGVGALGSHTVTLCRNLDAQLVLLDFDRVESKNLLAQAFVKPSIGKNKAEALKLQLANFYGVKARAFGVRVAKENVGTLLEGAGLVVDCFDNAAGRNLLSAHCRATSQPLVHGALSADGTFGLVRWDERFIADAEDAEGQATCEGGEHLPLIGLVAAALARSIQDYVRDGVKRDYQVSLNGVSET